MHPVKSVGRLKYLLGTETVVLSKMQSGIQRHPLLSTFSR